MAELCVEDVAFVAVVGGDGWVRLARCPLGSQRG